MVYCWTLIVVCCLFMGLGGADIINIDDSHKGNYTYVCREDSTNIFWNPPAGVYDYSFIDLYYTRAPQNGNTYKTIIVISWTPRRFWQVTINPTRFIGRLSQWPRTDAPTTNFTLDNVVTIDNGLYELSATTSDRNTFVGKTNLVVYSEENYFPKLEMSVNATFDGEEIVSTYSYTWRKPKHSPSIGVRMLPLIEDAVLEPKDCQFEDDGDGEITCMVEFDRKEWNVIGRVTLQAEFIFPKTFKQCVGLDLPPTNLIIDIPFQRQLAKGHIALIVIICVVVVTVICVVPPLVLKRVQKKKHTLSLAHTITFLEKCVDTIQASTDPRDMEGLYRRNTPDSVIKAHIMEYKKSKGNTNVLKGMFDDIPKKDLASCIKYILKVSHDNWLPVENQENISKGEQTFETSAVRKLFSQLSEQKIRILATVFRHLDWFLVYTGGFPDKDSRQICDKKSLATCLAPNFFPAVPVTSMEMQREYTTRWTTFVCNIIDRFNDVFPVNNEDIDPANQTKASLLSESV